MNSGLALITGVNYAGKGQVISLLKRTYDKETHFFSGSQLMREAAGNMDYFALKNMPVEDRDILRMKVFNFVNEVSSCQPCFLDSHFLFEDGEIVDYSPLLPNMRTVISVTADPHVIWERRESDVNRSNHPGRSRLETQDFIKEYQMYERVLARRLVNQCVDQHGRRLLLIEINNSGNTGELNRRVEGVEKEVRNVFESGLVLDDVSRMRSGFRI